METGASPRGHYDIHRDGGSLIVGNFAIAYVGILLSL